MKVIESESDSIMLFVDVGYFLNFEFIFLVRFWMNIYIYIGFLTTKIVTRSYVWHMFRPSKGCNLGKLCEAKVS